MRRYATLRALFSSLVFTSSLGAPFAHQAAFAGPEGGEVVGGDGTITYEDDTTTILQESDSLAIDWDSFDVDADERVHFIQPDSDSVALNNILSNHGSTIHGQIDANGHVFLINPNGVIFGEGAVINAGGILASGLRIDPQDFMNGDYIFSAVDESNGFVLNQGLINAAMGGSVALIGTQVENEGVISAQLGSVSLAAGTEAVVTFDQSGLLGVTVTEAVLQDDIGVDAAVINSGEISAESGQVLLTAAVSQDIFSSAVNAGELRHATSVVVDEDGSFTLSAGSNVENNGAISVSGEDAGSVVIVGDNVGITGEVFADSSSTEEAGLIEVHSIDTTTIQEDARITAASEQGEGGDIKLLGGRVGLFDEANIIASGNENGGQILVGGDYRGENVLVRNASATIVSGGVALNADALSLGSAGRIILWGDDALGFYGDISAQGFGGADGGFVETSAHYVELFGEVNTGSLNGENGQWLIDPWDITIRATDPGDGEVAAESRTAENGFDSIFGPLDTHSILTISTLRTALNNGANVRVETNDDGGPEGAGTITLASDLNIHNREHASLTLVADQDILINANITDSNSFNTNDSLSLTLVAGNDITIAEGVSVATYGGYIAATGRNFTNYGTISTAGGIVTEGGSFLIGGTIEIDDSSVEEVEVFTHTPLTGTFSNQGTISTQGGLFQVNSVNFTLGFQDNTPFGETDRVVTTNWITTGGGDFSVYATGAVNVYGSTQNSTINVDTGGGDFVIGGDLVLNEDVVTTSLVPLSFLSYHAGEIDDDGNIFHESIAQISTVGGDGVIEITTLQDLTEPTTDDGVIRLGDTSSGDHFTLIGNDVTNYGALSTSGNAFLAGATINDSDVVSHDPLTGDFSNQGTISTGGGQFQVNSVDFTLGFQDNTPSGGGSRSNTLATITTGGGDLGIYATGIVDLYGSSTVVDTDPAYGLIHVDTDGGEFIVGGDHDGDSEPEDLRTPTSFASYHASVTDESGNISHVSSAQITTSGDGDSDNGGAGSINIQARGNVFLGGLDWGDDSSGLGDSTNLVVRSTGNISTHANYNINSTGDRLEVSEVDGSISNSGGVITFIADGDITINGYIADGAYPDANNSNVGTWDTTNITFTADDNNDGSGSVYINAYVETVGGNFVAFGSGFNSSGVEINTDQDGYEQDGTRTNRTTGGDISITVNNSGIGVIGDLFTETQNTEFVDPGSVTLNGNGSFRVEGDVQTNGGLFVVGGSISTENIVTASNIGGNFSLGFHDYDELTAEGELSGVSSVSSASLDTTGGAVHFYADGSVNIYDSLTTDGGSIVVGQDSNRSGSFASYFAASTLAQEDPDPDLQYREERGVLDVRSTTGGGAIEIDVSGSANVGALYLGDTDGGVTDLVASVELGVSAQNILINAGTEDVVDQRIRYGQRDGTSTIPVTFNLSAIDNINLANSNIDNSNESNVLTINLAADTNGDDVGDVDISNNATIWSTGGNFTVTSAHDVLIGNTGDSSNSLIGLEGGNFTIGSSLSPISGSFDNNNLFGYVATYINSGSTNQTGDISIYSSEDVLLGYLDISTYGGTIAGWDYNGGDAVSITVVAGDDITLGQVIDIDNIIGWQSTHQFSFTAGNINTPEGSVEPDDLASSITVSAAITSDQDWGQATINFNEGSGNRETSFLNSAQIATNGNGVSITADSVTLGSVATNPNRNNNNAGEVRVSVTDSFELIGSINTSGRGSGSDANMIVLGDSANNYFTVQGTATYSGAGIYLNREVDGSGDQSGNDTFNLYQDVGANISAGEGADIFNIYDDISGALDGGEGSDNYNVNAAAIALTINDTGVGADDIDVLSAFDNTDANTWTIDGATRTLTNGGLIVNFAGENNIESLQGADGFDDGEGGVTVGVDTFDIQTAFAGQISGGNGNDIFNINNNITDSNSDTSFDVLGGEGNDDFYLDDAAITVAIDGGAGSDTIQLDGTNNAYWRITSTDGGNLGVSSDLRTVVFDGAEVINGSDVGNDTFYFDFYAGENAASGLGDFDGLIDARGGDFDSVNLFYDEITNLEIDLSMFSLASRVSNAEVVRGDGDASTITITGGAAADSTTTWAYSDIDAGQTIADGVNDGQISNRDNTVLFLDVGSAVGNEANDVFTFTGDASASDLDGATGENEITGRNQNNLWSLGFDGDSEPNGQLAQVINASTNTVYVDEFANIQIINGGSLADTLVGRNQINDWQISAIGADSVVLQGGSDRITFTGMETLQGNDDTDNFYLYDSFDGSLNGGAGNDVYNVLADRITANIDGEGNPTDGDSFGDTLNAYDSSITNEWVIDGLAAANTLTNDTGVVTFRNVENLTGGDATEDGFGVDTFTISGSVGDFRSINAGTATDSIIYTNFAEAYPLDLVGFGSGITSIEAIQSGAYENDGDNNRYSLTLISAEDDGSTNEWSITGEHVGSVSNGDNSIVFYGFEDLYGNQLNDEFTFVGADAATAGFVASVNGGRINPEEDEAVGTNTIVSQTTGADIWTLLADFEGSYVSVIDADNSNSIAFENIQTLTGDGNDTLNALDQPNFWELGGTVDTPVYTVSHNNGDGEITFSGMSILNGASDVDTIYITTPYAGQINAGGANDIFVIGTTITATLNGDTGNDSFYLGDYTNDDLGNVTTDGSIVGGIIRGGAQDGTDAADSEDRIYAQNNATLEEFTITAAETGTATNVGNFYGIEIIDGRDGNDEVTYNNSAASINLFVGGEGDDTFDTSGFDGTYEITLDTVSEVTNSTNRLMSVENIFTRAGFENTLTMVSTAGTNYRWVIGEYDHADIDPDGINDGQIYLVNGDDSLTPIASFVEMTEITGGAANDQFVISTDVTDPVSVYGIETRITGGDAANDRDEIVGHNLDTSWTITNADHTFANGIVGDDGLTTFSDIEVVTGGSGVDTFDVQDVDVVITLDGGTGADVVGLPENENVDIAIGGDIGSLTLDSINVIQSNGTNSTLTFGSTVDNDDDNRYVDWQITGEDRGTVAYVGDNDTSGEVTEFINFQHLIGGREDDTFTFTTGTSEVDGSTTYGAITGSVRGIAADATEIANGEENTIAGHDLTATWVIGETNVSVTEFDADVDRLDEYLSQSLFINALLGGVDTADTFQVEAVAAYNRSINGNSGGGNSIEYTSAANTRTYWELDESSTYVELRDLNGALVVNSRTTFSNIDEITGGAGQDVFVLSASPVYTGTLDAAEGYNVVDISGFEDNDSSNYSVSIDTATGNIVVAESTAEPATTLYTISSINRVVANEQDNVSVVAPSENRNYWEVNNLAGTQGIAVDGTNDGVLENGPSESNILFTLDFENVTNLVGGTVADTFTVDTGAVFSGAIDGGTDDGNSLTWQQLNSRWDLTAAYTGNARENIGDATAQFTFENIQTITGNDSYLYGIAQANQWSITASDSGSVGRYVDEDTSEDNITFVAMANLVGNTSSDYFPDPYLETPKTKEALAV